MTSSGWAKRTVGSVVLWLSACAPAPQSAPRPAPALGQQPAISQPAALAEETEPPSPELRTGRIPPVEHAELLVLEVRRHALDGDDQLLELLLPEFAAEVPGDSFWLGTEARLTGSSAPFQLVSRGQQAEMVLWLRRPRREAGAELMGDAYTRALGARPGHHFRFRAAAPGGAVTPGLPALWASAAVSYLASLPGAFGMSAAARLASRYKLSAGSGPPYGANAAGGPSELGELMDTFTGRAAVQAAIATRRNRVLSAARQPRTIPIEQLPGPALSRHPWRQLSGQLGGPPPDEALASAVPAEFYFVRAQSFRAFTELLSFLESFAAPAADLLDGATTERSTLARYLTELGLETGDLSRVLGPEVIHDFAICGSDPYVHQGSDVTLVFRLKSPLLFRAALLKSLTAHGSAHGGLQSSTFTHEGVPVVVARSPDGRVRRHHAVIDQLELISNSPAAIRRVISAALGKAPRLADELDFRYMLARDAAVPAELLAFVGDRFVENVVGPVQKIGEARRQLALAELTSAPVAALLYGWLLGRSPADRNELVRSGLLAPAELKHQDGSRIDWTPGAAPRSGWGTPAALEPLIDLPQVAHVSGAERDGYAQFAQQYQQRWSEYIDPIALRVSSNPRGDSKSLHAELRMLPLVSADPALRFDFAGDGRVAPPELAAGARVSVGIGETAYLRQRLGMALDLLGSQGSPIRLDWLGDYALLGVADRGELLTAVRASRETRDLPLERPASAEEWGRATSVQDEIETLSGLPVYAAIGLRSRVAAAVALTGLRRMAEDTAPGTFEWAAFAAHRGVEVVRIMARERNKELALYYALAADALIVSMNRSVMRSVIDQALDGRLPAQARAAVDSASQAPRAPNRHAQGQVVFELAPTKKGPLRTLLGWALSIASLESSASSRAAAEAVLRGAPESAHEPERSAMLSVAYLGISPLTPDGRRYRLGADGISDPLRGTLHAPEWPAVPTPESAAARVMAAFGRLRSDLSFDTEPQSIDNRVPLRSLRVRLDLTLR